jgi:hypothetical protein
VLCMNVKERPPCLFGERREDRSALLRRVLDHTPAKFRSKSRRRPSGWPYAKKAAEAREEYERKAKRRLAYYTGGR